MEAAAILTLEVLGVLLLAAGAAAGAFLVIGWASLAVAGLVVLGGAFLGQIGSG